MITKLCTPIDPTLLSFIAFRRLDGPAPIPSAVSIKPSIWSPPVTKRLTEMDIKAAEIFGQFKFLNKIHVQDCKRPMKIPMQGAKRAILSNLGLINGHWGKTV